jgi:hypothetical protein
MNVIALLQSLAPSLFKIIDDAVPDKDLAVKLKHELSAQMLSADSEVNKAASSVVIAEVQGDSWLQRNWRPMLMIWFSVLIGAYWFGFVPVEMDPSAVESLFDLVTLGIGGYVIGRSGEKIANTLGPILRK